MTRLRSWSLRARASAVFRGVVFGFGLRCFKVCTDRGILPSRLLLSLLCYGWGNRGYRARIDYLLRSIELASERGGAILECGSGLSTVLVGYTASRRAQRQYVALEHMQPWHDRVNATLKKLGVFGPVEAQLRPLLSYGDFDWYKVDDELSGYTFDLVLCDGPPSDTRGGRVGLTLLFDGPLLGSVEVMLDDAGRPGEQAARSRWTECRDVQTVEAGENWLRISLGKAIGSAG